MALRSLRSLTVAFAAAFLVTTLGTGAAIHIATGHAIERLVDRRLEEIGAILTEQPLPRAALVARIDALARQRETGDIGVALADAAGRPIGGNVSLHRPLPPGFSSLHVADRIRGLTQGRALVRRLSDGATLTLIAETEPIDHSAATRDGIYVLGFGSIIAVVLGGFLTFSVIVGRRIAETRRTVEAIIDGDMARRVPLDPAGGVFAEQARAFNRMLDRIAELMAGIANVSNDIAHDLRTPLARLRTDLARLARRADEPGLQAGLDEAIAQTDEVLAMFGAMLRIAEIEGSARQAAFVAIDARRLIADVGELMSPVVVDSGRTLAIVDGPTIPIRGDARLLTQALVNLIENAVHHTPRGAHITLSAASTGDATRIVVADDGPGIAADDRAQALRRFGRLDRSRHAAGHGLGLPLVQAIARLHRGTLTLSDAGPGLRVALALPGAATS